MIYDEFAMKRIRACSGSSERLSADADLTA